MKALRVMAVVMMAAFVGVSFVACGGQKAEAPAEEAPVAVEAVADSAACCCCDSAACDSCCADSAACCAAAADSCCAK